MMSVYIYRERKTIIVGIRRRYVKKNLFQCKKSSFLGKINLAKAGIRRRYVDATFLALAKG